MTNSTPNNILEEYASHQSKQQSFWSNKWHFYDTSTQLTSLKKVKKLFYFCGLDDENLALILN